MQEASTGHHPQRWFDGHSPQEHMRDALQVLLRVLLLCTSLGCR